MRTRARKTATDAGSKARTLVGGVARRVAERAHGVPDEAADEAHRKAGAAATSRAQRKVNERRCAEQTQLSNECKQESEKLRARQDIAQIMADPRNSPAKLSKPLFLA